MTIEDIIMKAITLEDEKYFILTNEKLRSMGITKIISEHKFQGLLRTGPKQVDLAKNETIPIISAGGNDGTRPWVHQGNANAIIIVSNTTGKIVATHTSILPHKTKVFRHPSENIGQPPEDLRDIFYSSCTISDLRKIVAENKNVNLGPDIYVITGISFDWKSNSIQIEVVDSRIEEPTENIPPLQYAKPDLFIEVLNKPEDEQKGLEFTLPEKISTGDASVILKASFPIDSITPLEFEMNEQDLLKTIPFHLILLKQFQNHDPIYSIPIVAAYKSDNSEGKTGFFEIDLRKLVPTALTHPGKYYCYLAGFNLFSDAQVVIVEGDSGGE
ncbi:hypothetical protein CHISP_3402 [Chitinispirillum alkaliphilum]|nr:hypothetical protein CHISP_3402 [Chitinispirillum alkaliphilum]